MRKALLLILLFLGIHDAFAATYYIDYVGGSDSNNGLTTSTPWKRAPGMQGTVAGVGPGVIDTASGVGGICGSICDLHGYNFIFKGGVTVDFNAFKWTIRAKGTGTGANVVYYGVDQSWYTGGSWARPIFNFGGTSGPKCAPMIQFAPVEYVVFDNFEFTGLYWDHTCNGQPNGSISYLAPNTGGHNEFKNLYLHGWSHEDYAPNSTADGCDLIGGDTQGIDTTSTFHDSVVDGSDVDNSMGYSCAAVWGSPPIVYNNYITAVPNGAIVNYPVSWYQNTCTEIHPSFDPTQHDQCYESNADRGVNFYNNLVQHMTVGISINISTLPTYTSHIWNNVIWDVLDNGNVLDLSYPANTSTGGSAVVWNNTIEGGVDGSNPSSLLMGCLVNYSSCLYQNNHMISSANSAGNCTGNCSQDHNTFQTQAQANADGYSSGTTYPFSPTTTGSTVGAGTNLTASCSGVLASLCVSSSVGVGYNATSHTVIAPNDAGTSARPSSAAWDSGAYFYSGAPTPGNGGLVTTASVASTTLTLNWTKATDASTAQSDLEYEVCQATANTVGSVAGCEAATIIRSFIADINTFNVTGLTPLTTYYFNVVVKNDDGVKAAYASVSVAATCGATKVVFTSQPGNAATSAPVGTVTVNIQNASSTSCTDSSAPIVIANTGGTCTGMTLGGTASGNASFGTFSTTNLSENAAGSCTLTATSSGLTSAVSNAFTVSAPIVSTSLGIGRTRRK